MAEPRLSKNAIILLRGLVQSDHGHGGMGQVVFKASGLGSPKPVTSRTITEPILAGVPLLTELLEARLLAKYGTIQSSVDIVFVVTPAGRAYTRSRDPRARVLAWAMPLVAGIAAAALTYAMVTGVPGGVHLFATAAGFGLGVAVGNFGIKARTSGLTSSDWLALALGLLAIVVSIGSAAI